jgi:hypothetical protein
MVLLSVEFQETEDGNGKGKSGTDTAPEQRSCLFAAYQREKPLALAGTEQQNGEQQQEDRGRKRHHASVEITHIENVADEGKVTHGADSGRGQFRNEGPRTKRHQANAREHESDGGGKSDPADRRRHRPVVETVREEKLCQSGLEVQQVLGDDDRSKQADDGPESDAEAATSDAFPRLQLDGQHRDDEQQDRVRGDEGREHCAFERRYAELPSSKDQKGADQQQP